MSLHDFAWFAAGVGAAYVPSLIVLFVLISRESDLREDAAAPRDDLDEVIDRVAGEMAEAIEP